MPLDIKRSEVKASIMVFFFDIEAKRTRSILRKLFRSEANTFDRKKFIFEAKRTRSIPLTKVLVWYLMKKYL
jgi:hypothetical protein